MYHICQNNFGKAIHFFCILSEKMGLLERMIWCVLKWKCVWIIQLTPAVNYFSSKYLPRSFFKHKLLPAILWTLAFSVGWYLEKTRKFRQFVSQGKILNKICQILLNLKVYRDMQTPFYSYRLETFTNNPLCK